VSDHCLGVGGQAASFTGHRYKNLGVLRAVGAVSDVNSVHEHGCNEAALPEDARTNALRSRGRAGVL